MERNIEQVNDFTQKIVLEWSAQEIDGMFKDKVAEYKGKIQVPGFRVGKAPISIIKTRFGNLLLEDIKQSIIEQKIYDELGVDSDKLLGFEDMQVGEIAFGKPFEIVCMVEVQPEINAENYKGLSIEKKIYAPSDEAVDEAIENLREQFASLEEIEEPSKADDYLVVKLGEDLKYLPLSADLSEVAKEQLIGLSKGEEKDIEITFPDIYVDKTIAGKNYKGPMTVSMVKRRKLPDVNLDFMKSVFPDIQKEEEFRDKVAENIKKQTDQLSDSGLKSEAIKALIEVNDIDVPRSAMRNELYRRVAYQYGVDPSKIGREKLDELVEDSKDELRTTVLSRWLLEDIAQKEDLSVEEADMNERMREISASGGMDLETVKQRIIESGEEENLKKDLLVEKALKFVIDSADIVEKEVNLGERES